MYNSNYDSAKNFFEDQLGYRVYSVIRGQFLYLYANDSEKADNVTSCGYDYVTFVGEYDLETGVFRRGAMHSHVAFGSDLLHELMIATGLDQRKLFD